MRLWKADSSSAPSAENWNRRLIFLVASSLRVLVDDVADMLEVDGEGDDLHRPLSLALVETAAGEFGDVELDRLVKAVDAVVHLRDLVDQRPVVGHHRRHHLAQHDLDVIAHMQGLAGGIGQRERGRLQRALVEIARP